jgi:hypothetical protein
MKKSLLLYLFILAVLMNIFTYAYFSRKAAAGSTSPTAQSGDVQKLKDSINVMYNNSIDANYFSLESNQNAQNYIVNNDIDKIIPYDQFATEIMNQLMANNDNPEGNPYTGQPKVSDNRFIINKAKILNHRWIVADFSDGQHWGEALIKYFVNPDKTIAFENIETFVYQQK